MKYALLTLYFFSSLIFAQVSTLDSLGLSAQVTKFLNQNGQNFSDYKPSCKNLQTCDTTYFKHEKVYRVDSTTDYLFEKLVARSARETWQGSTVFEMLYDRVDSEVYTKRSEILPKLREGQLVFLTLKIVPGLKIPVVFQILEIDHKSRQISFSYVETNKSKGIQTIRLEQDLDQVKITHTTHYKSNSVLRDRYLYPLFHEKLVDEFYELFFNQVLKTVI